MDTQTQRAIVALSILAAMAVGVVALYLGKRSECADKCAVVVRQPLGFGWVCAKPVD